MWMLMFMFKHWKKFNNELFSDYFVPSHVDCTGEGGMLKWCVMPEPLSCHSYLHTVYQAFCANKQFSFEIIKIKYGAEN